MAWGAAIGAIIGGGMGMMGAQKQASAMDRATKRSINLQREQFDYAKSLQEALLRQQESRRQSSQRAMRSLSMLMGLGDPGASASIGQQQELQSLKDQLSSTDRYLGPQYSELAGMGGRELETLAKQMGVETTKFGGKAGPQRLSDSSLRQRVLAAQGGADDRELNPEYLKLQEELEALESELPGGEGFEDDFEGPQDITKLPGYQFMQDQGLDALSSSGAARGMQLSGSQMEDITKFGQGLASQYRGQLIGELQSMAGMRPSNQPVTNLGNLAVGQAGAIGPLMQQQGAIGAAQAAGTYGNLAGIMGSIPWGQMGGNTPSYNTGGYQGPPSQQSAAGGPGGGQWATSPFNY